MSSQSTIVAERIHESMDVLTGAERRVARALLADYPAAGLGSSYSLAAAAGVSAPTAVRMAVKLGFDGFTDMQGQLRAEISGGAGSPVLRTKAQAKARHRRSGLAEAMQRRVRAMEATLRLVPADEVGSAADLIATCPASVLVVGGFFSGALARTMALQLSQLRNGVIYLEEPLRREAGQLIDAKRRSVVVLFDMRRYEAGSLALARMAKRSGFGLVLITDRWMSPVASIADVVLPVEVEAIPFDTFVAALALVEIIVELIADNLGTDALKRMERWEKTAVGHMLSNVDAI